MSNATRQFIDPAGTYTGGYTSNMLESNFKSSSSNQTRAVIQVKVPTGSLDLQMRLTIDAPWVTVRTYTSDIIEEVVLANFTQIIVSANAKAWLGETK